jgi:hypothetical protein
MREKVPQPYNTTGGTVKMAIFFIVTAVEASSHIWRNYDFEYFNSYILPEQEERQKTLNRMIANIY